MLQHTDGNKKTKNDKSCVGTVENHSKKWQKTRQTGENGKIAT